jgi:lysophospholipase L1-like esterase
MNKRILITFLLIAICILSCDRGYPIKNLNSQGKNIICFGNSITKGEGVSPGKDYPAILSYLLERKVINAGVSGDTTITALERLERDVLKKDPYLVIVELGGNDFLQKISKKVILKNLEEIILRIQEKGAMVAIVDVSCGIIMSAYKKDIESLARRTGSIFIPDVLENILNNPSLKYDIIHPNDKGYKIIAHRIYKKIKKYITLK